MFHKIILIFNSRDKGFAKSIRTRLGFGLVRNDKSKNSVILKISRRENLLTLGKLILNKLKDPVKIAQFNVRIIPTLQQLEKTSIDTTINFNTPWFAGFVNALSASGAFCAGGTYGAIGIYQNEIRLVLKIDQKSDILLRQIKDHFGGYLGYTLDNNTHYYQSIGFKDMFKILKYFDRFTPKNNSMCLQYVIMRKVYLMVENKLHLTKDGMKKIQNFKKKLEKEKVKGQSDHLCK